jgi:hypothetical protein
VRRCGEAVSATGATRGPRVAVQLARLEVFPEEQLTAGRRGRQERAEEPMEPAEELNYLWVEGEGDHEDGDDEAAEVDAGGHWVGSRREGRVKESSMPGEAMGGKLDSTSIVRG